MITAVVLFTNSELLELTSDVVCCTGVGVPNHAGIFFLFSDGCNNMAFIGDIVLIIAMSALCHLMAWFPA